MSNDLDRTLDRSAADPDTLCKCRAYWPIRCGACSWPVQATMPRDCEGETQQDMSGYGWRDYDREPDTAFARWCVGIHGSASLDSYGGSDE